jgi:hypothetical protein
LLTLTDWASFLPSNFLEFSNLKKFEIIIEVSIAKFQKNLNVGRHIL